MAADVSEDWSGEIFAALRDAGIRQVAYVPDAGLTRLIEYCCSDNAMRAIVLTGEQEGPAVLAGAWLGGQRGVLLMQSSGVGNCPNMLAMVRTCRFPMLAVVTMRGQWGEFNPWQVPMGQSAAEILRLAGFAIYNVDDPAAAGPAVAAAARIAFEGQAPAAVLLSQRMLGAKTFDN